MKENPFMSSAVQAKRSQEKAESSHRRDMPMKALNFSIPAELHEMMLVHRAKTGESMKDLVTRVLYKELR